MQMGCCAKSVMVAILLMGVGGVAHSDNTFVPSGVYALSLMPEITHVGYFCGNLSAKLKNRNNAPKSYIPVFTGTYNNRCLKEDRSHCPNPTNGYICIPQCKKWEIKTVTVKGAVANIPPQGIQPISLDVPDQAYSLATLAAGGATVKVATPPCPPR